jgi:hypothetical protein
VAKLFLNHTMLSNIVVLCLHRTFQNVLVSRVCGWLRAILVVVTGYHGKAVVGVEEHGTMTMNLVAVSCLAPSCVIACVIVGAVGVVHPRLVGLGEGWGRCC